MQRERFKSLTASCARRCGLEIFDSVDAEISECRNLAVGRDQLRAAIVGGILKQLGARHLCGGAKYGNADWSRIRGSDMFAKIESRCERQLLGNAARIDQHFGIEVFVAEAKNFIDARFGSSEIERAFTDNFQVVQMEVIIKLHGDERSLR